MSIYSALHISPFISKALAYNKEITRFYLPPTYEPYLPLLPSFKASPPSGWYSLCLPTNDGQAELTWVAGYIPR